MFSIENVFYFSLSLSLSLSIENVFSIENVIAIELEAGHLETSELFLDTHQSLVCSLLFRIASSSTTSTTTTSSSSLLYPLSHCTLAPLVRSGYMCVIVCMCVCLRVYQCVCVCMHQTSERCAAPSY